MASKKNINFETALEDLEELVEQLEDGDLSLEQSLSAFEKGIKLTRQCQGALDNAQQKVQLLLEENGDLKAQDFFEDDVDE